MEKQKQSKCLLTLSLKECFEEYLEEIKNKATKINYKGAFKYLKSIDSINLEELTFHAKQILKIVNVSNNTKNLMLRCGKAFFNGLSVTTKQIFYSKSGKSLPEDVRKRQAILDEDGEIVKQELINFKNPKFKLIVELLDANGTRLLDFTKLPFHKLNHSKKFKIVFLTSKTGKQCDFKVPNQLIPEFLKYGKNLYKYNTIQNLFKKFSQFVEMRHPNGDKPICAHVLRHNFAVRSLLNGSSPIEVALMLGHTSPTMLFRTYFNVSEKLREIGGERAQKPRIEALEIKQLIEEVQAKDEIIENFKKILEFHNIDYKKPGNKSEKSYNVKDTRLKLLS